MKIFVKITFNPLTPQIFQNLKTRISITQISESSLLELEYRVVQSTVKCTASTFFIDWSKNRIIRELRMYLKNIPFQ